MNAADRAQEPHYHDLNLSMAQSWLTLARQEEAVGKLLATLSMVVVKQTEHSFASAGAFEVSWPEGGSL
jgi:hypothetical protein